MIYNINPSILSCIIILSIILSSFLISFFLIKLNVSSYKYISYIVLSFAFIFTFYILGKSLFGYIKVNNNTIEVKSFGEKYLIKKDEIKNISKLDSSKLRLIRKNGIDFLDFKAGLFSENGTDVIILTNSKSNQEIYFIDKKLIIPSSIDINKFQ